MVKKVLPKQVIEDATGDWEVVDQKKVVLVKPSSDDDEEEEASDSD